MNLYETLGVKPDATQDEIKKAYRSAAMKHHPDRGGDRAEFQKVEEAGRILLDPEKRQRYDATGETKDGPTEEDMIRAGALNALTKLMSEVVQQADNVGHVNILDEVKVKVRELKAGTEADIKKHRRARDKHEKAIKRLKAKKGENIAANLLQQVVGAINASIKEGEMHLKIASLMVEIIEDHDYEIDADAPPPHMRKQKAPDLDDLMGALFGRRL